MTTTDTTRLALWCELRDAMTTAEHGAPSDAGARLLDAMAEYVTSRAQGDEGLTFAYLDHVAQVCHMAGARLAATA